MQVIPTKIVITVVISTMYGQSEVCFFGMEVNIVIIALYGHL